MKFTIQFIDIWFYIRPWIYSNEGIIMEIENFNLRVYGVLFNDGAVLVTDEYRDGLSMTKFPGGGLEKGEGIKDCLQREFQEELKIKISIGDFLYVNDFFQQSAFKATDQLICFYYLVETNQLNEICISEKDETNHHQTFRWLKIRDLIPEDFTFPIDRNVAELIKLNA